MTVTNKIHEFTTVYGITYRPDTDISVKGDLYLPEKETGTRIILLIHGGGWNSMARERFDGVSGFLAKNGYAVFNIDYRLLQEAPYPACEEDCLAAANFILTAGHSKIKKLLLDKIIIAGASAGGHLALMTGLKLPRERIAGIISIAAPTDLTAPEICELTDSCRLFDCHTHEELTMQQKSASPVFCTNENLPPILITHCCHDSVVPFRQALRLEEFWNQGNGSLHTYYYSGDPKEWHNIWRNNKKSPELLKVLEDQICSFLHSL